jgi:hypothetical protein
MKKLIYGISILFLFASCKTAKEIQKTDPINDPSLFIGNHKAKAMVLGVFHFSNPQLDSYKPKFPFDILEKQRQSELDILLEKIAEYRPTKILLELNRIEMDSLTNESYQSYLKGKFLIDDKNNEVYQIGFKLAKKLNHHRVYCSDADAKWFGVNLDWDKYDAEAYLKSKGQYEKTTRYDYESLYKLQDSLKTIQSLTRMLNMLNNPVGRLKDHQAYLTNILEGAGDNYLGADNVGRWYRRNLRIFSNAYDFTNFNKEERLLLIYGSGHVWLLRQFFMDSPDFEYVEANDYLKD